MKASELIEQLAGHISIIGDQEITLVMFKKEGDIDFFNIKDVGLAGQHTITISFSEESRRETLK